MTPFFKARLLLTATAAALPAAALADHPVMVFGEGAGGGVITPSAATLEGGAWAVAARAQYLDLEDLSHEELEREAVAAGGHAHSADYLFSPSIAAAYGITDRLTVGVRVPYLLRSDISAAEFFDHGTGAHGHANAAGDSAGIGDATLAAHWRWHEGDGFSSTLSLGTIAPTGAVNERGEDGSRFTTDNQPGNGAWSPFAGATASWQKGDWAWHANALYTIGRDGAQATETGDVLNYNLAAVYRLPEGEHGHSGATPPHPYGMGADRRDQRRASRLQCGKWPARPRQRQPHRLSLARSSPPGKRLVDSRILRFACLPGGPARPFRGELARTVKRRALFLAICEPQGVQQHRPERSCTSARFNFSSLSRHGLPCRERRQPGYLGNTP